MNKKIILENIIIFVLLPFILFLIFLKPILPKSKLEKAIIPLQTARIDIKNFGKESNGVKVTQLENNNAKIWDPKWFKNGEGQGTQIEIIDRSASFKIKCVNDGKLQISLKGVDFRNNNGKRYPIWIDYTSCKVNGKNILNDSIVSAWHDKSIKHEINVKDNDEITLEVSWIMHNYSENEIKDYMDVIFKDSTISAEEKSKFAKKLKTKIRKKLESNLKYELKKIISTLQIARIDIKNFGKENNAVKVTQLGNNNAKIWDPKWFKNGQGQGTQIEIADRRAIFKIKCVNDGKLQISLRGVDRRNNEGKRYPIWIDYTSCKVNGKNILNASVVSAWHDKSIKHEINVKNNDEILLEIKWKIHNLTNSEIEDYINSILKDSFITEKEKNKLIKITS